MSEVKKVDLPNVTGRARFMDLGVSGLRQHGGILDEQPLRQLKGHKVAFKTWREMSRYDDVVGAALFAFEQLARQVEIRIDAGGDDPRAQEQADFVEECFSDMSHSWQDLLTEILSMLWAGFSVHEIVYKRRVGDNARPGLSSRYNDGRIGWRKMPIRSQETIHRWHFDDEGGIRGVEQHDPTSGSTYRIPVEKLLLFRPTTYKGNPEGRSILERAFVSWYRKSAIQEYEAIGIERDLTGLPVLMLPPELLNATSSDDLAVLNAFKDLGSNVRRDEQECVLFPLAYDENGNELYRFELMSSGGSRQFDTTEIIRRYNQAIAGAMLADFILLGHEKVGSFALADSKTELFAVALGSMLDQIVSVFNTHAIPRLLRLNGMPTDMPPRMVHGDIESVDLQKLGEYIGRLSQAGLPLFPDAELENHLRGVAGMPLRQAEGEMGRLTSDDDEEVPGMPDLSDEELMARVGAQRTERDD